MNKYHILYTEDEGGDFKYIAKNTDEETMELFKRTVETKQLLFQVGDVITSISPAYICLVQLKEDFDFVLGRSRDEKEEEAPVEVEEEKPVQAQKKKNVK